MLKNIDVNSLKNKIGSVNIIDIRSVEKYNTSHIETSINIPMEYLIANTSKYLSKDKQYFIYCQYGKTSVKVCLKLYNEGYNVVNIFGGYEAWLLNN